MSHSELRDGTPRSRPGEWLIVNACFLGFSTVLFLFGLLLALVSLLPLIVKVTFSTVSRAGRSRCTREAIQRLPSQRFLATQPHNSHLNSVSFAFNAILGNFSIDLIFFYYSISSLWCVIATAKLPAAGVADGHATEGSVAVSHLPLSGSRLQLFFCRLVLVRFCWIKEALPTLFSPPEFQIPSCYTLAPAS